MTKNGQNEPKMAKNSPKYSKCPKIVLNIQPNVVNRPTIPTPNCVTKNCENFPENNLKINKITQKWPK